MKENNKINLTEKQKIVLEAFATDGFLSVNKRLLSAYGPNLSIYIGNLLDKFQYFMERQMLTEDGGFFLTYENQQEHTGMSEYQLRKCKNKLITMQLLNTEMRGIPPKEFYFLNFNKLIEFLMNIPKKTKGINTEKLEELPQKNFSNIKDTKYNENKYNENINNNPDNIPNMNSKDIYNIKTNNNNIPGINISKTHKCVLDTEENEKNSFIKNGDNTSSIIKEKETGIGSIKERIVNSSIKEKNTISAKIRNKKYIPLAEKLSAIICEAKNVRHSKKQITAWADPIRKLIETNGVDYSRVEKVLDWYKENIDGEFIPRIETGYALRQKFIALEDAMKRQNTVKQPKQFTNSLPPKPGEYDWVKEVAKKNMRERIERAGETGFFAQARKRMLEEEGGE